LATRSIEVGTLGALTEPAAVLAAVSEFDRIGREAFLEKYGFGPARSFFLVHNGKRYDSKAIVGAAVGFQHPQVGPLRGADFVGGDATVRPKLESLGFTVLSTEETLTRSTPDLFSEVLKEGEVYSRTADLAPTFGITDATLNTGVFQPKGSRSIWLFVTLKKTSDRTQYVDRLEGDVLHWGRPDKRSIRPSDRQP
jgi:putative restriction endonuclease